MEEGPRDCPMSMWDGSQRNMVHSIGRHETGKRGVFIKICPSPKVWEPFKVTAPSCMAVAIWKKNANSAHRSVRGLFSSTYSCWQRRYEPLWNLIPIMHWAFKVKNIVILCRVMLYEPSAIRSPPWYWQQRNEPCSMMAGAILRKHWRLFKENGETQFSLWKKPTQVLPIPSAQ